MYFYFVRLLNICLHVIDNVTPGAHSAKVSSLKCPGVLQPRSRTLLCGFGKCKDAFSGAIVALQSQKMLIYFLVVEGLCC